MTSARSIVTALALTLWGACGQDQVLTPPRALNRPTDMSFACVQLPGQGGQPAVPQVVTPDTCQNYIVPPAGAPPPPGPIYRTLGFISNSATGEVAVAGLSEDPLGRALLFDLDARAPGYNFLPVGRLPGTIQTTKDGCSVFVVNEGSCDLSGIDVGKTAIGVSGEVTLPDTVRRIQPHTSAGPILARPHTLELLPTTAQLSGNLAQCLPTTPYHAFVAYPSCDLVAEIDLVTGDYIRGIFIRPAGFEWAGPTPSCPAECTGDPVVQPLLAPDAGDDGGAPDAGTPDAGTLPPSDSQHARPGALALRNESTAINPVSLFVAGASSRSIWWVNFDAMTAHSIDLTACPAPATIPPPANPQPRCDPVGVTRLRIGPPLGGVSPGNGAGEFLYAAALDGSVRVVRIDAGEGLRECETQADPQIAATRWPPPAGDLDPLSGVPAQYSPSCLPIDENIPPPPGSPPLRRATAVGPGIRVVGTPTDIAFAILGQGTPTDPLPLAGLYAFVLGSTGVVTVVNVDSHEARPRSKASHQLHNGNADGDAITRDPSGDPGAGGPFMDPATLRQVVPGSVGLSLDSLPSLARIARICPDLAPQPAIHWPDLVPAHLETWTFGYEAGMPNLFRGAGALGSDTLSTLALLDAGAHFCTQGAQAGDFVVLGGCQDDTQCALGQFCSPTIGGRRGICLSPRPDSGDKPLPRLACQDVIASRHEFRVKSVGNGHLILDERPLVIARPGGCTTDDDCKNIDGLPGGKNLFPVNAPTAQWICDPSPWPGSTMRQCVRTCSPPIKDPTGTYIPQDTQCIPNASLVTDPLVSGFVPQYQGFVCGQEELPNTGGRRRCVSARIPRSPQNDPTVTPTATASDCFINPISYEVHAGLAFLITGDQSGYFHNQILAADGTCTADPSFGPKRLGRVSYNVPACSPSVQDGYDIGTPTGAPGICYWNAEHPLVTPNPCLRVDTSSGTPVLVWQLETPAFETAVGPVIPGLLGNNYSFVFTVTGGFRAFGVGTHTALPSTIHLGSGPPYLTNVYGVPNTRWLYLIDQGDQISPTLRTLLLGQMARYDALTLQIDTHPNVVQ